MRVGEVASAMERIAPARFAESWDNVGLLVGDADAQVRGSVVLTIDLNERVLAEAGGGGCVVAYHPPIFGALKRVTAGSGKERLVLRAAERGVAVYSPHTALDATPGGVADWLVSGVMEPVVGGRGGGDVRALVAHAEVRRSEEVKIVTFVPRGAAEKVRDALASSGAGRIGAYEVCAFSIGGTGTFLAGAGATPTVGEVGRLERVEEDRLEMVCSKAALALALEALKRFHPYEEPAVDVYELVRKPMRGVGAGRRVVLDRPAGLGELVRRMKAHLGVSVAGLSRAGRGLEQAVGVVGVCPGSGGGLLEAAIAEGCELFVTGELKHHDVLAAAEAGMAVLTAGHTRTERGYLPRLAERLSKELGAGAPEVRVSVEDRDPVEVV